MTTRADLHSIVDTLPNERLEQARTALSSLNGSERDPVWEFLQAAPFDDEPFTDEQRRAAEEARVGAKRGESVTLEEFKKSLGDA